MAASLTFQAIKARQSNQHDVFAFAATAEQVFQIARIERAGRSETGDLFGFQRPQVAQHIAEIRDYLKKEDSVLPNSIVLAFVEGVKINDLSDGRIEVEIEAGDTPPGLIVDGQQRLSALQPLEARNFQVFVSAIVCRNDEELRRQFILINNTRPLPKELIYELLPSVTGLPHRMSSRSFAADLTTKLNYTKGSSLEGRIRQHTNPRGIISSNAIQRVVMNSRSNGAVRELIASEDGEERALNLISEFYWAVRDVFPEAWEGMTPKTSRLVHSVGIIALGYCMEIAYALHGARDRASFKEALGCLEPFAAWTSGHWNFPSDFRPWNKIQNTPPDIRLLSDFLVRIVRDQGMKNGSPNPDTTDDQKTQTAMTLH
jgi:DGQHR domain-containing protein